jgi:predicted methyltransferase
MPKTLSLLLFFIGSGMLAQQVSQENSRQAREEYSRLLRNPMRDPWQVPDSVVAALAIKSNEDIASIEPGDGYFARRFARSAHKVYVIDAIAPLLQASQKEPPTNLFPIQANDEDSRLPPTPVDTIFLYNVLPLLSNRPFYYLSVLASLKPHGRVVIIDYRKQPPSSFIPLTQDLITAEMQLVGFKLTSSFTFLPSQFFLVFTL